MYQSFYPSHPVRGRGYQDRSYSHRYPINDSGLKSSAVEFTPTAPVKTDLADIPVVKSLNAMASDFQPTIKGNLNSEAPVFEMSKIPGPKDIPSFKAEKINEYVPENLPDEKFDEPIFIIHNRELVDEDFSIKISDVLVKVDVKNVYSIEDISSIYKEIRGDPLFEKVPEYVKDFAGRVMNTVSSKRRGKNKEGFKGGDWRDNEAEIIATVVWRKPKTEEEEKISSKAKAYKMKITGNKEEHDKIKRSIKSTLNKVLPTNLEKLQEQLLEIGKQTTNNLIFLVECIFDKAWSEVKYTQTYANLCKFLKERFEGYVFAELENDPNFVKRNLFKYELLERCQQAFTSNPDENYSNLPPDQIEVKKEQNKKKTLGNVRFIGELFKVGLITSKVILNCAEHLISKEAVDENKLEGACILLSTGGSSFERLKLQKETEKIFKSLTEILKIDSLTAKIRFKIMDLIDERNNSWKKNFKEEVKTIQEIHQEFEQEMRKKRML
jgi:translation initiation factor 4G